MRTDICHVAVRGAWCKKRMSFTLYLRQYSVLACAYHWSHSRAYHDISRAQAAASASKTSLAVKDRGERKTGIIYAWYHLRLERAESHVDRMPTGSLSRAMVSAASLTMSRWQKRLRCHPATSVKTMRQATVVAFCRSFLSTALILLSGNFIRTMPSIQRTPGSRAAPCAANIMKHYAAEARDGMGLSARLIYFIYLLKRVNVISGAISFQPQTWFSFPSRNDFISKSVWHLPE